MEIYLLTGMWLCTSKAVSTPPYPNTYNLNGDVNATGSVRRYDSATISGKKTEGSAPESSPDLVIMNYAVNNTHNVSQIFTDANVTHDSLPVGNELRDVFVINPSDRNPECASTDGDDYFFEPHTHSPDFIGGSWNTAPTPLHAGTDRIYYINGNLWVNSKNDTYGFNMDGKATIVVTGNIYICDNLKYASANSDMLGLVALGKYNSSGQTYQRRQHYFRRPGLRDDVHFFGNDVCSQ